MKSFWNTLPSWAKGIVAVGGLAIGYFAVRGFLNKIKQDASQQDLIQTQKSQEDELKNLADNNIKPTFNQSQYNQWADSIQQQFSGCDPSLSVAWLTSYAMSSSGAYLGNIIMQFKNDADFLALSTAWGSSRSYDQCGLFTGQFSGNLTQAVRDELDSDEIKIINKELAKKGIKYNF